MARQNGRKFETYTHENGTEFEIRYDPEEHEFFADAMGIPHKNTDLKALMRQIDETVNERAELNWKLMLKIEGDRHSGPQIDVCYVATDTKGKQRYADAQPNRDKDYKALPGYTKGREGNVHRYSSDFFVEFDAELLEMFEGHKDLLSRMETRFDRIKQAENARITECKDHVSMKAALQGWEKTVPDLFRNLEIDPKEVD